MTERLRGQYIKAEDWDFPVMTERTRLISYLLYGLFSVILEKSTIRTPEVIFHIRLGAKEVIRGRDHWTVTNLAMRLGFFDNETILSILRQDLGQI